MELFMSILLLLSGVGVFLAGMRQMSNGLKQSAGAGIKGIFNKISSNRFAGYAVGMGATAIVQSSSATTVMTIGLANAGIVNTRQGSAIILGAKVGTTVTGFIVALSGLSKGGFSAGILFASFAFVGAIMLMVSEKEKVKNIGTFLLGFGMLFLGLEVMSMAVSGSKSALGEILAKMFASDALKNPVLLIIIGTIFTCIIQSSSAATAIFITFLTTGVIDSVDQSFFLVLGANIGTCVDGIMASIGSTSDGKKLALFHLLTSIIGAIIFGTITAIFRKPIVNLFNNVIGRPEWSMAIFNLSYNVIYTLLLLPFLNPLLNLMDKMIKDKAVTSKVAIRYLNPQLLKSASLAIEQAKREMMDMAELAMRSFNSTIESVINGKADNGGEIAENEKQLNYWNREIPKFLVELSKIGLDESDALFVSTAYHTVSDLERIGDYSENLYEYAQQLESDGLSFSDEAKGEMREMQESINEVARLAGEVFAEFDFAKINEAYKYEQHVDDLKVLMTNNHIKRLADGSCTPETGSLYYAVASDCERISDHLINIVNSTRSYAKPHKKKGKSDPKTDIVKKSKTTEEEMQSLEQSGWVLPKDDAN